MKLKRYKDKKETRKKVILISLTMITLVSVLMMLYKTFAKFTTTTSFSIMSGKVVYKSKGLELGTDISPSVDSDGNGLYQVEHLDAGSDWNKPEYRYGGKSPNNYVYFNCNDKNNQNKNNCELWRIIGKVNVKTGDNTIEQRLKIIRNESLGNYAWDKNSSFTNDWTKSELRKMLNDGYFNSQSNVNCYIGNNFSLSNQGTCDFNGGLKGLTSLSKEMIDNQVIWTLGAYSTSMVTVDVLYEKERETVVYQGNEIEWSEQNDHDYHKGVGLMYPSDYGYAVGGSVRNSCVKTTNLFNYDSLCAPNNWLKPINVNEWLLTSQSTTSVNCYGLGAQGYVMDAWGSNSANSVRPTAFLKNNVKIGEGEGTQQTPYNLIVG